MRTILRSRDARYSLLVVGLAFLLLLPALVQPMHLIYPNWGKFSDLVLIHWPKIEIIRETLAEEHAWPLWSPYALSGQPLAGNQLAMLFYPPALLLLLSPRPWAFALLYALHLAWAGLGAYWLARSLGRHPHAALLAGAILALNGKLAAHMAIGHTSLLAALAWVPWAFVFFHLCLARRSGVFALLAGVALAAQAATHTYALIYTAYGLVFYIAAYLLLAPELVGKRCHAALNMAPRLALVPLVGALLGAVQLLPLMEMGLHSNRSLSLAEATLFSLSPLETLAGLLFPLSQAGHEMILYPGLATLLLAAGAWRARRKAPVLIFGGLVGAGILLALGSHTPLYPVAYWLLPGLQWVRTPARLWFFVALGLAVLAAYGFEAWADFWKRPARRNIRLALVATAILALLLGLGAMLVLDLPGRGAWGVGLFGTLAAVLCLWAIRRRPSPLFGWLALLLVATDLLSFGYTLYHMVPLHRAEAEGRAAATWLGDGGPKPGDGSEPFRVYSPSYSLPQPAASEAGLEQIDGVEPVHLAGYDRFMALAGGYGDAAFSVTIPPFPAGADLVDAHRHTVPDLELIGLLNGRYLVTAFPLDLPGLALAWQEANTWIYENEQALPRALVVHRVEPVTAAEVWDRLPNLEPARVALVEGGQALNGPERPTPARVVEHSPNRLVVEAELDVPGFLLLGEIWYPGWQARDNGGEIDVHRADAVLRGVYLGAGRHTVEFNYQPWTVRAGGIVSGLTALGLLACFAARRWRQP